jgi:hypothetical protein
MSRKYALPDTRHSSEAKGEPDKDGSQNASDYTMNVIASAALASPYLSSQEAAVRCDGVRSLKPADAIEIALAAQIVTANDTALELYRRAWMPNQTLEVRAKYLALADKAARTLALLSDTLDRRRGRGQQQIIVKHVTVTAEQAVVADQIVTGR